MSHFHQWQPIRFYHVGEQPRTARHLDYYPAWDVVAICDEPDGEIPIRPSVKDESKRKSWNPPDGKPSFEEVRQYIYRDRHIDRRFYLEYPSAARDSARVQGGWITDTWEEWDKLIEIRDSYLAREGLTPDSPARDLAKGLAEIFSHKYFKDRELFTGFKESQRQINHPLDALVYQCWCVGCSQSFVALANSLGLPSRGLGLDGHRAAEVFVDGKWRYVENSTRHGGDMLENDSYFDQSYMDLALDPWGEHGGARMIEGWRAGQWWRINPWVHINFGTWVDPHAFRYSTRNAAAVYPENTSYAFKTFHRDRLTLLNRSFSAYCHPVTHGIGQRIYPLHRFVPGQKMRESFYLDSLDGVKEIELAFCFDDSRESDLSDGMGRSLIVQVGDYRASLAELKGWPPKPDSNTTTYPGVMEKPTSIVRLPADLFRGPGVNWYELRNEGKTAVMIPCVPAVLEPYIPPLWLETDAYNPPLPKGAIFE